MVVSEGTRQVAGGEKKRAVGGLADEMCWGGYVSRLSNRTVCAIKEKCTVLMVYVSKSKLELIQ